MNESNDSTPRCLSSFWYFYNQPLFIARMHCYWISCTGVTEFLDFMHKNHATTSRNQRSLDSNLFGLTSSWLVKLGKNDPSRRNTIQSSAFQIVLIPTLVALDSEFQSIGLGKMPCTIVLCYQDDLPETRTGK